MPVYNEQASIQGLYRALYTELARCDTVDWSVTFVDDGSTDESLDELQRLAKSNRRVEVLALARNFGKEVALSAGLHASQADAVLMLDADLQHPPRYIHEFITKWLHGAQVVVGVRSSSDHTSWFKRAASSSFYSLINTFSDTELVPHSTDFRLLDKEVVSAFRHMSETNRITRGMIDWLGFKREYVYFTADQRMHGTATYSPKKLIKLATDSFVSMTLLPLRLSVYLGVIIASIFGILGFFMALNEFVIRSGLVFSGPASLAVLILFLVGIILINIGFVGLYVANINQQVKGRPLFIVNEQASRRKQP